jgi:hypothetical protein
MVAGDILNQVNYLNGQNSMSNLRWDPYLLASCLRAETLLKEHFQGNKRLLFILAKGFDIRMNFVLQKIRENCPICQLNAGSYVSMREKTLIHINILRMSKRIWIILKHYLTALVIKKNLSIYGRKKETVKDELAIEKPLLF